MASRADERRTQRSKRVRIARGAGKSHLLASELLAPADIAALANVSAVAVRAWRARGILTGDVYIGGTWLYSKPRVLAFLRERAAKHARDEAAGRKPPPRRRAVLG